MNKIHILTLSFVLSVNILWAGNMEIGKNKYASRDYSGALPYLQSAAKDGYGEACYLLGNMYMFGLGTAKSYDIAMRMYKRGLEYGYGKGEAEIGLMYEQGNGVQKNLATAVSYYKKSIAKGISNGYYFLGIIYSGWEGEDAKTKRDSTFICMKNIKPKNSDDPLTFPHWYGYVSYYLGLCYEYGYGTKADIAKAVGCYNSSFFNTKQSPSLLYRASELLRINGLEISGDTGTSYSILEWAICKDYDEPKALYQFYNGNKKENFYYLEKAAKAGYGPAQRTIAECYDKGINTSINKVKAAEYNRLADEWFAKNGEKYEEEQRIESDAAYRNLKGIYRVGDTFEQDSSIYKVTAVSYDGKYVNTINLTELEKKKRIEEERKKEQRRLDTDMAYRNSKGIYRKCDLWKDIKNNVYVVLSVDKYGKPEELMVPKAQTISFEQYEQGMQKNVLSPSQLELIYKNFDKINNMLVANGLPVLVEYRYITNYTTGTVVWQQTFTYNSIGDYIEKKTLRGKNIYVMLKYSMSELKAAGLTY